MSNAPKSSLDLSAFLGTHQRGTQLLDEMHALLGDNGYVYVHGVPEQYDYPQLLATFGQFVPQYDGTLVWDLKPEPDMDHVYHSKNTRALLPHTEAYEFPGDPPRWLALWCIKQAQGEGGETTLADGHRFLERFTQQQLAELRQRSYNWHSTEGLAAKGIYLESVHPILDISEGRTIIRYSYNNVDTTGDGVLENYLEEGKKYFDSEHLAITIETNCLLLWDNWRMIHSRNAFTDRSRHLKRVLIK